MAVKDPQDIVNEDPSTANHARRLRWADMMRQDPDKIISFGHRWMLKILDNTTVAAAGNAATDSDVQFVINSLIDTMAG